MTITFQRGDYVLRRDLEDEVHYERVVAAIGMLVGRHLEAPRFAGVPDQGGFGLSRDPDRELTTAIHPHRAYGGQLHRPRDLLMAVAMQDLPDMANRHYRNALIVPITEQDVEEGHVRVILDPYRLARALDIGGGPREQLLKKAMRGGDKGDGERALAEQCLSACQRWLEMLDEEEAGMRYARGR